ncbi:MAG TPA: Z1 domain-containing protein [Sphingomicrobium sp.]|nr:Z1 domain-containing protein [Sphingomicrobium sp.]
MEFKRLPTAAANFIQQSAARILGFGQDPAVANGQRTGLVVGYVQSGKTLSFTTVIALARDNNIPIVIVVAGTSVPLFEQTVGRLLGDLQVDAFDGPPRWIHVKNPDLGSRQTVENAIANWRNPNVPQLEKATLLLTVMKHHRRLDNLNQLLAGLNLTGVPAVVVDDEADQASLNNLVNRGEESTTYGQLLSLMERMPNHTFLQYTATPQAPLLINIADILSPEFVDVLEPGDGYVGGEEFFGGNRQFTRVIPQNEIPSADNPLLDVPETLLRALKVFFVGVSAGRPTWGPSNPNRSMLVHPSRTTEEHFQYFSTIRQTRDEWVRILALPETNPDRRELVQLFQDAHTDIQGTAGADLPAFDVILDRLGSDMENVEVREVNRRKGNRSRDFNWRNAYAWILVGGQAMDRGFTVRELTVTYMPRGIGTGNADTLQQRARFFGYKRPYLGYCRIYLEAAVSGTYEGYVNHEEEMRDELRGVRDRGEAMSNWKRRFVLSDELNPCRASVIQQNILRGNFANDWYFPRMLKLSDPVIRANRDACDNFCRGLTFVRDRQFAQLAQQHDVCENVLLRDVIDNLLLQYRVEYPSDTERTLGMLLQLSYALRGAPNGNPPPNPNETVRFYKMRPGYTDARRGLDANGRIGSIRRLMQGPTRSGDGYSYPGDWTFCDADRVTVQLHRINFTEKQNGQDVMVSQDVPVLAIWIPGRLSLDWIIQDQQGQP